MDKTVCELFAGVGGFRCGLNHIKAISDVKKGEKWKTVWFSQWEPVDKKIQWAHDCYVNRFGVSLDKKGNDTTNCDISTVDKRAIPDHSLLVGGFPCQDYSVSQSLKTSKGIEGKKGVLWWSIYDVIKAKRPPFVLLENVDRLLKSPSKQRGRDFGIILACLSQQGYIVEWRVINAADYGWQQRRRRTFIFAYRKTTNFGQEIMKALSDDSNLTISAVFEKTGFFARCFKVGQIDIAKIRATKIGVADNAKRFISDDDIKKISDEFKFDFECSGIVTGRTIYTVKTVPDHNGKYRTLGDIKEKGAVDDSFFVPEERLYYTDPDERYSDETDGKLPTKCRQTWQYLKGGKKILRKADNGHEYVFSEGPIPMIDADDKPARTMLTSEGGFSRTTHIVKDNKTGKIRLLTPVEMERIQGFPDNWTKECLVDGEKVEMPLNKRRFMMGNALVVNLISQMEEEISKIFDRE